MPGGQGKSRIHAAITLLFLQNTDYNISVVFQNEGLLKADEQRNDCLIRYCDASSTKWSGRVRYQTDLRPKNNRKTTVLIIDESDERMFKDLEAFYKATKSEKVITICLTATAYEGGKDGLQRTALEELGYKVYYNTTKKEDYEP